MEEEADHPHSCQEMMEVLVVVVNSAQVVVVEVVVGVDHFHLCQSQAVAEEEADHPHFCQGMEEVVAIHLLYMVPVTKGVGVQLVYSFLKLAEDDEEALEVEGAVQILDFLLLRDCCWA